MKTIFEIIEETFELHYEVYKIDDLFCSKTIKVLGTTRGVTYTLKSYIDAHLFHVWEHRGICLTIYECQEKLKEYFDSISNEQDTYEIYNLSRIEFILNMLLLVNNDDTIISSSFKDIISVMMTNINIILEKLDKKFELIDKNKYIIIDKDPNIIVAANILKTPNKVLPVLEYTNILNRGNLREKKSLLIEMAHEFEPRRQKLKNTEFSKIESNLGDLFNKLNLRHNKVEGHLALPTVANMPAKDLELWYDKTYKLYLLSVLASDFDSSRVEIKTFLEEINKK